MYRVEGKIRNVGRGDGTMGTEQAPAVEFHTAAGLLRWALNTRVLRHGIGGRPYPTRFDDKWLGDEGRDGGRGYDYHLIDTFSKYKITSDHLAAMRRAQRRYREIVHYWREVEPRWVPDTEFGNDKGEVHWADNSVEVHEVSLRYGTRRHRMVLSPFGDTCF